VIGIFTVDTGVVMGRKERRVGSYELKIRVLNSIE